MATCILERLCAVMTKLIAEIISDEDDDEEERSLNKVNYVWCTQWSVYKTGTSGSDETEHTWS